MKGTEAKELQVSQGQVTFDAEGNDIPGSQYFSRKITWPGNNESGVTVGRGYDMGNRSKESIIKDLTEAGVPPEKAKLFAEASRPNLKGAKAGAFVKKNREKLGEITRAQQKALFELDYPRYLEKARKNYDLWTKDKKGKPLPGKVDWCNLDQAIRDVLTDFVYQGFTKGPTPMRRGMRNDYDELIKYIETNSTMKRYEPGRHCADYLRNARPDQD